MMEMVFLCKALSSMILQTSVTDSLFSRWVGLSRGFSISWPTQISCWQVLQYFSNKLNLSMCPLVPVLSIDILMCFWDQEQKQKLVVTPLVTYSGLRHETQSVYYHWESGRQRIKREIQNQLVTFPPHDPPLTRPLFYLPSQEQWLHPWTPAHKHQDIILYYNNIQISTSKSSQAFFYLFFHSPKLRVQGFKVVPVASLLSHSCLNILESHFAKSAYQIQRHSLTFDSKKMILYVFCFLLST